MAYDCLHFSMVVTLIYATVFTSGVLSCPSKCLCNDRSIRCTEKKLTVIPDFKKVNKSFTTLDLSGNDIEEVKTTNLFSGKLITLEYLHLNDNSIIDIEETAFSALLNLRYLDLSNNLLEDIPSRAIQRNGKLEELNLSGNLFSSTKTPELISTSLQVLDLSFSKISVFTENNLKELPGLRVLYLHANSLKHVDYNIFVDIKLQYVDLSFNCWKCSCETIKLFDYLVKAELTEVDRPIQCMHANKWYEDIYNSKGPMHHNKLCKKRIHSVHHADESVKSESKENSTKIEITDKVVPSTVDGNNKKESELQSEDFAIYVKYEIIIIGTIAVILTLVSTIILKIFISKSRKPKNHIYEELMESGAISSKIVSEDLFSKNSKSYNHIKA